MSGRVGPLRVLVVEDEPLIAMIVEDALEAFGCAVIGPIAQLGQALVAAGLGNFDCAILDINIRGGLSYPVADVLVAQRCPILMTTGYRNEVLPANLAGEDVIAKPYTSTQLREGIKHLCDRVAVTQ